MASRVIYGAVAAIGIAAASAAAWWVQSRPMGPTEIAPGNRPPRSGTAGVPAAAGSAPRAAGVEVSKAERSRLQDDAQSVGSLRSRQSVMLRPEVAGRVKALGFADGAVVRKGQVLVQLDDTLQRAEIKQARAQVSIAQANLARNQELVAQSFVARRVLDESAANLQVADAQLALACARWSRMAIVAPFAGTVGMRNVNPGDFVKDGAELVNLEDLSAMVVDFRLPERYQGKLRTRQKVELQLDAFPGRVFRATVDAIDPLLDVNGRSVGVRAMLPNTIGEPLPQTGRRAPDALAGAGAKPARAAATDVAAAVAVAGAVDANGCSVASELVPLNSSGGQSGSAYDTASGAGSAQAPLRPGMFARVTTIFAIREAAIVVPEEAIVPQGGRQFVIKVVEPSQIPGAADRPLPADARLVSLRQEVKLGARQLGKVEITAGLVEGETVVVAGQQRLQRDGTPLRVVELARPARAAAPAAPGAPGSAPVAAGN